MTYCNKPNLLILTILIAISCALFQEEFVQVYTFIKDVYSGNYSKHTFKFNLEQSEQLVSEDEESSSSILPEKVFSVDELKLYSGQDGSKGIYLAILGLVFDVSKGSQHYGPGGGYEFFAGRDASRAFVSGDFSETGLKDDVTGLTTQDYLGLEDWVKFYLKDYKYMGKLSGRFYQSDGQPTAYNKKVQNWIKESHEKKKKDMKRKKIFPGCNSEWTADTGARVYCTQRSDGIDRDWAGVPRRYFEPGRGNQERCVCVRTRGPPSLNPSQNPHSNRGDLDHPNLKEYVGCPPDSVLRHTSKMMMSRFNDDVIGQRWRFFRLFSQPYYKVLPYSLELMMMSLFNDDVIGQRWRFSLLFSQPNYILFLPYSREIMMMSLFNDDVIGRRWCLGSLPYQFIVQCYWKSTSFFFLSSSKSRLPRTLKHPNPKQCDTSSPDSLSHVNM